MSDLDTEILKLRTERKSLRFIASALGVSHEAVRKRLKNLEGKVSTIETERKLPAAIQNAKVSTCSKAHESRASEESEIIVNLIPAFETPSDTLTEGVNPSGNQFLTLSGMAERGVSDGLNDLFGAVKGFLENHGVKLYRMEVSGEGYQVKHNGQVIRIYVQRRTVCPKSPGTGER